MLYIILAYFECIARCEYVRVLSKENGLTFQPTLASTLARHLNLEFYLPLQLFNHVESLHSR